MYQEYECLGGLIFGPICYKYVQVHEYKVRKWEECIERVACERSEWGDAVVSERV